MAAPASNTDVCNLACDAIGQPPITSVDAPVTNTELILSRHYDEARRSVFRESNLSFTKARAIINRNGTPLFDYSDSYAMPADFLRMLTLNEFNLFSSPPQPLLWWNTFDFSQGNLLINAGGALTLDIRYTQDVLDVTLWDAETANLIALNLATKICLTLTNDRGLLTVVTQQYMEARSGTLAINGQENRPRRVQRSRSLEARRGAIAYGHSIFGGTYIDFG
jgi:hypothetical protein